MSFDWLSVRVYFWLKIWQDFDGGGRHDYSTQERGLSAGGQKPPNDMRMAWMTSLKLNAVSFPGLWFGGFHGFCLGSQEWKCQVCLEPGNHAGMSTYTSWSRSVLRVASTSPRFMLSRLLQTRTFLFDLIVYTAIQKSSHKFAEIYGRITVTLPRRRNYDRDDTVFSTLQYGLDYSPKKISFRINFFPQTYLWVVQQTL